MKFFFSTPDNILLNFNLGEFSMSEPLNTADVQAFFEEIQTRTTVNLTDADLSRFSIGNIVTALKSNTKLETLVLARNRVGELELRCILHMLKKHPTVLSVYIIDNSLSDFGGAPVADLLEENTRLKSLSLGWNRLGPRFARHIAGALEKNTTLTSLNLFMNRLEKEGCAVIAKALERNTTLKSLDLEGNNLA